MSNLPTSALHEINRRFESAYRSAASKEQATDLTNEEACAIRFFAGVPYEIDRETGILTFSASGLYKRDGKWTVAL